LIAATSYNQTSRKPANTNSSATFEKKKTPATSTSSVSKPVSTDNSKRSPARLEQPNPRSTNANTDNRSINSRSTEQPESKSRQTNRVDTQEPVKSRETGRTESQSTDRTRTNNPEPNRTSREYTRVNNNQNRSETRSDSYNRTSTVNRSHQSATRNHERVVYSSPRVYRDKHVVRHHYRTPPPSREYRSVNHVYRRPYGVEVYWTPVIHRHFIKIYPMVPHWHYYTGYRIEMISAYDAMFYMGDVMTVYGQVTDMFYVRETDEYFMYFGAYYPYQDFTVVMPGYMARRYSHRPERYFIGRYMATTGLITSFNGEPEMLVKESFQINIY